MNWKRRFWAWMYRNGLYRARIIADGKTDNTRAIQARVDAGESVVFPFGIIKTDKIEVGDGIILKGR